ncbi:MAG: hypothetical protein L6R42_006703 [Xanthoria sp. 1 TBL-2021]|nr:MAG: hypothetical protein L6R42_006703 [Xanthoria sp. 1 TBL-2021]
MDPSNHDKALLSRLNALKPSSISLSSTSCPFPPNEQIPNITTRFHSLKSAPNNNNNDPDALIASITEAPNNENEDATPSPTVEELLADLGPEEQWRVERDEGEKICQLMEEARGVLVSSGREEGGVDPLSKQEKDRGKEEGESRRNEEDMDDDDEEEAARQLQRILDELDVEETDPTSYSPQRTLPSIISPAPAPVTNDTTTSSNRTTTTLTLPSVPLTLPSVPLTHPSPPKTHPQPSKNKDPTSTWCTICLADATAAVTIFTAGGVGTKGMWVRGRGGRRRGIGGLGLGKGVEGEGKGERGRG